MKAISKTAVIAYLSIAVLYAVMACAPAWAQTTGGLHGSVTDPAGAQIPGATLTFTQVGSKFHQTIQADAAGTFTLDSLPTGIYQLTATAPGFRGTVLKNVAVTSGQVAALKVELALASTSETIDVYGTTGELEPFKSKTVSVGPLGDTTVVDLPYSVNTIPGNVIESQHITTLADLVKYIPSAAFEQRFGLNIGRLMTRGFQASVYQNVMVDGMYLSSTTQFPLQAYERVEVMNGLGGGLYGPANPSGTFDFILKRPTDERTETFGADYDNDGIRTFRGDFGGSLGPKKFFGYRLNFLEGDGTAWVDKSRVRQDMESGAFDFHLAKHTTLEVNYFHSQYNQTGLPGAFGYASTVILPKAPDPSKPGLGQPFAGLEVSTTMFVARLKHEFNQNFRLLAGVGDHQAPRDMWTVNNTLAANYTYTAKVSPNYNKGTVRTAILYLNGEIKTGPIQHKLALGARAYSSLGYGAITAGTAGSFTLPSGVTIYNPGVALNTPVITKAHGSYKNGNGGQESLIFGDTASWGKWMASFTGSFNNIFQISNTYKSGVVTHRSSETAQTAFTPTASMSFKPKQNMTAYFAYSSSVIQGESTTGYANASYEPYLPAEMSHQYEAGYKAEFNQLEVTTALFRIDRPIAYADTNNIFRIQGEQVNRGLELNVKGKVNHELNIFSGLTWLDPRMHHTYSATGEGKQYPGAARITGNILADYQLTRIRPLREVSVNANYHLMGKRATNEANTNWTEAVSTLDLGARYSHKFGGVLATGRFGVMNATNKFYWASIMPGSQMGQTNVSDTANLGAPRTYNFSLLFTLH